MQRIAAALLLALAGASFAQGATNLNVVVILDNSGSMAERLREGGSRMDAAKRSLLAVLERTSANANVGVILLNPARIGDTWLLPLRPVDRQTSERLISQVRAQGPTPLGGAMKIGADELLRLRESQRYGEYKLLLVTDGEATDGNLVQRYLPDVQARGLLVDVIGVAMDRQHSLAKKANTYRNAEDPASLEQAISAVVLGESTSDTATGDAGASDFEVLAPIPGELATAALGALSNFSNEPITAIRVGRLSTMPTNATAPASQPQNAPQPRGKGLSFNFVFVAFVLFFVISKVIGVARKMSD